MEAEIPSPERSYREVSPDQISAISPHKLRALVRSQEHEMRTRRKPIVELQLTRKQAEVNLLSTPATTEVETARRKADAADISNVELASTCTSSGCAGRDHLQMQLNTDTELTKVELNTTYRHRYDIH
jgi:hypothetical protein